MVYSLRISWVNSRRPVSSYSSFAMGSLASFLVPGVPGIQGGHQAADADFHGAQVGNVVDFQLGIQLSGLLQNGAEFIGGDGVHPAAEGDQLDEGHVGLGADIPGRVVHPGVVGPLVEHPAGLFVHVLEHCVLSDEDKAEGGDQVVDAVVDLRVHVVGLQKVC